jgi:hypothetical protein
LFWLPEPHSGPLPLVVDLLFVAIVVAGGGGVMQMMLLVVAVGCRLLESS